LYQIVTRAVNRTGQWQFAIGVEGNYAVFWLIAVCHYDARNIFLGGYRVSLRPAWFARPISQAQTFHAETTRSLAARDGGYEAHYGISQFVGVSVAIRVQG